MAAAVAIVVPCVGGRRDADEDADDATVAVVSRFGTERRVNLPSDDDDKGEAAAPGVRGERSAPAAVPPAVADMVVFTDDDDVEFRGVDTRPLFRSVDGREDAALLPVAGLVGVSAAAAVGG